MLFSLQGDELQVLQEIPVIVPSFHVLNHHFFGKFAKIKQNKAIISFSQLPFVFLV